MSTVYPCLSSPTTFRFISWLQTEVPNRQQNERRILILILFIADDFYALIGV